MSGLRLFVAVELPDDVRRAAAAAAEAAVGSLPVWGRTHPDELHVTVAFLGASIDSALLDPIEERLQQAAAEVEPFTTALTGLGRFPDQGRPRIVWAGLDDADGGLARLAEAVATAYGDVVDLDDRPFRAHITVARAKRPARLSADALAAAVETRPFDVREVTLFRSIPSAAPGTRYEALGRWPLGPLAP